MLNYDALLEFAKKSDMPENKFRGILREYLQTLILKFMCQHKLSSKIYFLGGTYLRFVHHFKRFSEDLDFNGKKFKKIDFEEMCRFIQKELEGENLDCTIAFEYRGKLLTSKFIFNENLLKMYGISDRYGKIMIKIEVHQPGFKLNTDEAVINNFGEMFPILTMAPGYIFCEKMLALSSHKRGRHVYDLIMMLSNKFPIDEYVLKKAGIRMPAKEFLKNLIFSISDSELIKMALSLQPFLFKEKDVEYVKRAKFYLKNLL